jgi:small membrane protein
MNGIKILLLTGVIFIGIYFLIRLRNSLFDLILLLVFGGISVIFILYPELTNKLANFLGVGRGADLVFYISIIIFWFIILKIYARIRRIEEQITIITRKEAIDETNKNG